MEKVIFLDRDGTLNAEVNYLHRPEDLQLLPGVPGALRRLKEAGYKLVVVTNQAGRKLTHFFTALIIRSTESELIKRTAAAENRGQGCSSRLKPSSMWIGNAPG